MRRRVVVTGLGVVSPLGSTYSTSLEGLRNGRHGIVTMAEWEAIAHLSTRLAAPANATLPENFPRKTLRTMGRVAVLAAVATEEAVANAGLSREELASGAVGLAYGSTHGSSAANEEWVRKLITRNGFLGLASTTYLKFMSHTAAVNLAMHFAIKGRIVTTCAACVSGSQAVGYAYENIRSGLVDTMIAGGSEELHFTHAGVFDIMHATSRAFNDAPDLSPRPFDVRRDGLVVGEGAGSLVLEEYERAKARGANMYAEIIGFGTNCDGGHITSPSSEGMRTAMAWALKDADLEAHKVGYINAHATGTPLGDVAESLATVEIFGSTIPISSLKGHMGHTLGACGAIEAALCIGAMNEGFVPPTRNLDEVDPNCAPLDYVRGDIRPLRYDIFASNKFAFGGINTSLIFRKI